MLLIARRAAMRARACFYTVRFDVIQVAFKRVKKLTFCTQPRSEKHTTIKRMDHLSRHLCQDGVRT